MHLEPDSVVFRVPTGTIDNQSGRPFDDARFKLMAGDVNKISAEQPGSGAMVNLDLMSKSARDAEVTEKSFDDFHVYSLPRPTTLRNRKTEPAEVRVEERLYRWVNGQVVEKSADFTKVDAQNIEFRVTVPADGEAVLTYRVRYQW